jgi:hypothetical protein
VTNANRQVSYRQPIGAATNPGFDNPFWTILNNRSNTAVNRLIGNTELSYDILNWLNLRANVGVDTYSDRRSDFINAESAISPGGSYTEQTIGETQWNTNLFARATHRFSGRIFGFGPGGFQLQQPAVQLGGCQRAGLHRAQRAAQPAQLQPQHPHGVQRRRNGAHLGRLYPT